MGTLLEAIGIVLETHFEFGFPNRSPIGDSLSDCNHESSHIQSHAKNTTSTIFLNSTSNSNSFANFVWQMLLFANSQNDMGRKQKGHLQLFGNFESIRLSACHKSTRMQNAKLGVHKCQERRRICQLAINAKPNCQTVG